VSGSMGLRVRPFVYYFRGFVCLALGLIAAGGAFVVALDTKRSGGHVLWLILIVAYGPLMSLSYQFVCRTHRWFAAPLFVAGCALLTAGVWIEVSPAVLEDPQWDMWLSFIGAGIALVLALVTLFFPWGPPRAQLAGAAADADPDGAQADTRGWTIATIGVLGGLAGIAGACVTLGSHGLVLGLPAFVLAVIGIVGAALADGNAATGYVLLLATGVLGFFFAWFLWVPAGVLLVIAGLLEARIVRAHRARPRETSGI
jgi:hypothetical protein